MKPNLFDFATSELSQDAFICWLISWAKKENKKIDEKLHENALLLLNNLFDKHRKTPPVSFDMINVSKQDRYIDVLITVNDEYAIVIEDKTGTSDGKEKLKRYVKVISERDFPDDKIIPIYFKTGEQCSYDDVTSAGYEIFLRKDFLEILKKGIDSGINNPIYTDYYEYLAYLQDSVESFKNLPLDKWGWYSWIGFLCELKKVFPEGTWDYVANPAGGFLGFWWHFNTVDDCWRYLQIEEEKFCFKIEIEDKDRRKEIRNDWCEKIVDAGKRDGYNIVRPPRLGYGTWMTVAILNEEYRKTDSSGIIDMDETIKFLKEMGVFLDKVVKDNS